MKNEPQLQSPGAQDIQFRRSLFRFSLAFFLVLVAGGVGRSALNRIPLTDYFKESLQSPLREELNIYKPHFVFQWGILPIIGVKINRVEWVQNDCADNKISLQNGVFALSWLKLIQGEWFVSQGQWEFIDLSYVKGCGESVAMEESEIKKTAESSSIAGRSVSSSSVSKKIKSQLKTLFDGSLSALDQVPIGKMSAESVRILYREKEESFKAEGSAQARFKQAKRVRFDFETLSIDQKKIDFVKSKLEVELGSQRFWGKLTSKIREGVATFEFIVDNNKDYTATANFQLKKVPVSPVTRFINEELNLNYLWLTCELSIEGGAAEILKQKQRQ